MRTNIDMSEFIEDPEEMSLCPLCDQPIFSYEPDTVIVAYDVKCLAHLDCYHGTMSDPTA